MATIEKMTQAKAIAFVLENMENIPADVREKLEGMHTSLTARKPASVKHDEEFETNARIALDCLKNYPEGATVSQIIKDTPEFEEFSTSKGSSLLNKLWKTGKIKKGTGIKNKTLFFAFDSNDEKALVYTGKGE